MHSRIPLLALTAPTLALALPLVAPSLAHAGVDACGDIDIEADAQCELVAEGCDVQCTPVTVEAACAAGLQVECSGACGLSAEVECTNDCRADCEAYCRVDPGSFDCNANCRGDCDASCLAACDPNDSECEASCSANCSAECDASCSLVAPDADCVAQCESCCDGSCTAEVNLSCQLDCQADAFAECSVQTRGGCEADCSEASGALFCDGRYVDHGNNLDDCIDALRGLLDGEIEGSAELSCGEGECSFESEGMMSCSVGSGNRAPLGLAFGTFVLFALYGRRRR